MDGWDALTVFLVLVFLLVWDHIHYRREKGDKDNGGEDKKK
jgi:cbb3-type cytochrome oxidase subunit 3